MSSPADVLFSIAGIDPKVEVERLDKTDIQESPGGKEFSTSIWPGSPRWRYTLTFNGLRPATPAPSPWQSYSELGLIRYLVDLAAGAWGTFNITDPITGSPVTVRFEKDSLAMRRTEGRAWWTCQFSLLSVK